MSAKENNKKIVAGGVILFLLLVLGLSFYPSFTADTYIHFNRTWMESAINMSRRNGRPFISLFFILMGSLHQAPELYLLISSCLALCFLGLSVWCLARLLEKTEVASSLMAPFLSLIILVNPFILSYFLFVERGMMMFALLMAILATYIRICKPITHWLLVSTVLATVSMLTYQSFTSLYLMLCLCFAVEKRDVKTAIRSFLISSIPFVVSGLVSLFYLKLFGIGRFNLENLGLLARMLRFLKSLIKSYILGFNIGPDGFLLFSLLLAIGYLLWRVKRQLNGTAAEKTRAKLILLALPLLFLLPSVQSLVARAGSGARSTYSAACLFGLFLLLARLDFKKAKLVKGTLVTLYLAVFTLTFNKIFLQQIVVTQLDQNRMQVVQQMVRDYEEKTQIKVTKRAIYTDAHPQLDNQYTDFIDSHSGILNTGNLVKSPVTNLDPFSIYTYMTGEKLEKTEKDSAIKAYFKSKDWSTFSPDQIIIKGDTIHMAVY
ncbi:TPA: glucosyltransferase domain-containing protein [Streptococcus suis]